MGEVLGKKPLKSVTRWTRIWVCEMYLLRTASNGNKIAMLFSDSTSSEDVILTQDV